MSTKYAFVKEFVESDMDFKEYNQQQLEFFENQVKELGIEIDEMDEESFYIVKEILNDMYSKMQNIIENKESEEITMSKSVKTNNATANNNTNNEEMIDMKNVNKEVAATVEEITIGAKAFAEGAKDKVVDATKKVASTLSCIEEEAVKISSMNNAKAEAYIAENAVEVLEKFKNGATKLLNNIGIIIEEDPELEGSLRKKAKSLSEFIEVIQDTLDEEGVNGWGKFKAIMKEVAKFVLGLILKAAAVVLKIAFTLVVGAIKIGATTLVTAGKVVGVVNNEVVKPTTKDIKTTWANRKKKAEAEDDAEVTDDDFDEIEEELFQ